MILHWKKYSTQFLLTSLRKSVVTFLGFKFRLKKNAALSSGPLSLRHRPSLKFDSSGQLLCIACKLCQEICPSRCIELPSDAELGRPPRAFQLDVLKCIDCGLCQEVCPTDAISLTEKQNDEVFLQLDRAKLDLVKSSPKHS